MVNPMDRRLRAVVQRLMKELLTGCGFSVSGVTASRSMNHMTHCVVLGRGKYLSKDSYPVTATLGVISGRVAEVLGQSMSELILEPMTWHWKRRIGFLTKSRHDEWWDLGAEGSDQEHEEVGKLIAVIQEYGLPQFDVYGTEEGLLRHLAERFSTYSSELPYAEVSAVAVLAAGLSQEALYSAASAALASFVEEVEEAREDLERLRQFAEAVAPLTRQDPDR